MMPTTHSISQTVSVYELVSRDIKHRQMIQNVRMMSLISREIEDTIIKDQVRARVFSSFQRISSFLPQVKRYQMLAQNAESVYVFGHFDVTPPPIVNVRYIDVAPDHQLGKEWFVIAEAANYFTGLVTEEVTPKGKRDGRMFKGFWSFDEEMVTIIQSWLSNLVGVAPMEFEHSKRAYLEHIELMGNVVSRLTERLAHAIE